MKYANKLFLLSHGGDTALYCIKSLEYTPVKYLIFVFNILIKSNAIKNVLK